MVESGIHLITNGTLYRKINTERKNGFTERQRWSQIKWVIKTTFAHLCTPLTRDKCLPLTAVSGESSGDKGRFCHAFNPYLWRASKVYLISIVKYVWDSSQRSGKKHTSREFRVRLALQANAALLPRLAHKRLIYRLDPNLRSQSNSIAAWIPFKKVGR